MAEQHNRAEGRRVDNVEGMLPRRVQTELAPSAQLAEPDRGKETGKGVISYVDAIERRSSPFRSQPGLRAVSRWVSSSRWIVALKVEWEGGKGTSSTRLVIPTDRTLPGPSSDGD
jgi:hypothetical protein